MLDFLTDAIENTLDVVDDLFSGEINKHKVSKLIADGLTVSAIAYGFGVAEEYVTECLES